MDLISINTSLPIQYKTMFLEISRDYPIMAKASENFYKSQSQFMDNMFSVHQPTKLRSLRQILAEANSVKMALEENFFSMRKKRLELCRKQAQIEETENKFDVELLQIEIEEIQSQLENSKNYVEGAIRKIHAYIQQYKLLLKSTGKTEITEQDFEEDESRYHVMTAFEQGLCAARSHGGIIDEGNHIYFYQIGISGTTAQWETSLFLQKEGESLVNGNVPTHKMTVDWLNEMGDKYKNCPMEFAHIKGMELISYESLNRNTSL